MGILVFRKPPSLGDSAAAELRRLSERGGAVQQPLDSWTRPSCRKSLSLGLFDKRDGEFGEAGPAVARLIICDGAWAFGQLEPKVAIGLRKRVTPAGGVG